MISKGVETSAKDKPAMSAAQEFLGELLERINNNNKNT